MKWFFLRILAKFDKCRCKVCGHKLHVNAFKAFPYVVVVSDCYECNRTSTKHIGPFKHRFECNKWIVDNMPKTDEAKSLKAWYYRMKHFKVGQNLLRTTGCTTD